MDKEIITVENDMKDHFTEGHNKKEISLKQKMKENERKEKNTLTDAI